MHVVPEQYITLGGTEEPCGIATLIGIHLQDAGKAKTAADITNSAQKHLGIKPERYHFYGLVLLRKLVLVKKPQHYVHLKNPRNIIC